MAMIIMAIYEQYYKIIWSVQAFRLVNKSVYIAL